MVERMYGGTAQQWLNDLGDLADAAELDPAMCVAVAQAVRAVRDQLVVSEALHQLKQHTLLLTGEPLVGNDGGFGVGDGRGIDGQPSQVA
jgi:hypothetical protein